MNKKIPVGFALLFLWSGAQAANLLIYDPSVEDCEKSVKGAVPCNEIEVADQEGHTFDVVDEGEWAALTQGDFASYDAIVFGDGGCDSSDEDVFDAVNANKATWSPAVTGPMVVHTFDPFAHETDEDDEVGTIGLTANGINTAASSGGTGLYYPNGCRDDDVPSDKGDTFTLDFLSEFGTFVLGDDNGDVISILEPSSPVVAGLTEDDLSNWGSSTHAVFVSWPEEFVVIATSLPGVEKGNGEVPVLLVRGGRVVGIIPTLSPVGLGLLGLVLAGLGAAVMRRRRY